MTPPDPWQSLFARHKAALFLMARQYLPSREQAEDAVQEGFIKFWKNRSTARDQPAYLFTCVRSAALDSRRHAARSSKYEHATPPPLFTPPADNPDRAALIESALASLPTDQREVLILKIWSGLTFAQIASTLAIPPNTAASRYRYALTALEHLLAKEHNDA